MARRHQLNAPRYWAGRVLALVWLVGVVAIAQAQTPVGLEFRVNTTTANIQDSPAIAMDSTGNFVIAWADLSGQDGDSWGVFAQRYQANGVLLGAEFQVNTTTAGSQLFPAVAMDAAGNFVIAWTDFSGQDGDSAGIFAQRYQADGTAVGTEFQVNTNAAGSQQYPAIAMSASGAFVVTWSDNSGQDGDSWGVFAQRYQADGTASGNEFQVNTTTAGIQQVSSIAMDAAGNFVIAWTDNSGQDGDIAGIFAQRYQADGTALGSEFQVNTTAAGSQLFPAVAMSANGNFAITWTDFNDLDTDGGGVFAQRYQADGTATGAEFQVNTNAIDDQLAASIAMDAAGNFVIAWTDIGGQDGNSEGVFAQLYRTDGTAVGTEFQVNTTTANDQQTKIDPLSARSPLIAMDGIGHLVITWTDSNQDGSSEGVFAQRFQLPDTTAPRCEVMAINHGPPSDIIVHTEDIFSGIATIDVVTLGNATVEIPQGSGTFFNQGDTVTFTPATTALTIVRAEQIDPTLAATLQLQVTDAAGNVANCDPVVAELAIPDGYNWVIETFEDIPSEDHFVTIQNGEPGLQLVMVQVNQIPVQIMHLNAGETRTLDVAAHMVDGPDNTVVIVGLGRQGARALVILSDGTVPAPDRISRVHWQPSLQRGYRMLWNRR